MSEGRSLLRGIYVVLDAVVTPDLPELLDAVLAGGARVIQYRAKAGVDRDLAILLAARTHRAGGLFIVNDDLEVAASIPGAGLHCGQEDLAIVGERAVRERLPGRVFGISCGTALEAARAESLGADYIGIGPFATTTTKADAGPALGPPGFTEVARAAAIPTVAIGGIGVAQIPDVVRAGATMAAVVTAIARDPDPRAATERLRVAWERAGGSADV